MYLNEIAIKNIKKLKDDNKEFIKDMVKYSTAGQILGGAAAIGLNHAFDLPPAFNINIIGDNTRGFSDSLNNNLNNDLNNDLINGIIGLKIGGVIGSVYPFYKNYRDPGIYNNRMIRNEDAAKRKKDIYSKYF